MKKQAAAFNPSALSRPIKAIFPAGLLPALILLSSLQTSRADSATWVGAHSSDWDSASNWTPQTVPNGAADTATFHFASSNSPTLSLNTEVNGIVFDFSFFTIFASFPFTLTLSGAGVTNTAGGVENFIVQGAMSFTNNATAGSLTNFTNYGTVQFSNASTAGSGTFHNQAGSEVLFLDGSTAASALFTTDFNSITAFRDTSTAGQSLLIADGAGTGNLGGSIQFSDESIVGTARVQLFGDGTGNDTNGNLDISAHNLPGIAIGSIKGNGNIFLGANSLTIGSNQNVVFSGVIQDGGINGGSGGSLTKAGNRVLTLSGASTYTGGTIVSKGSLLVTNTSGSATGLGTVQVKFGTLGGTGTISGAVTVASGATAAALAPGSGANPGTLTLLRTLKFNARATYKIDLNSTAVTVDKVVAKGVTISGALVSIGDLGSGSLTTGTVFTVISNTAATPISGSFTNLPDGSTITIGSNTFQANYEGGTGNDLTLTVVP